MSFWTSANFEFLIDASSISIAEAQLIVGHVVKWDMLYNLKTPPHFRVSNTSKKNGCFFLPDGSEGTFDMMIKKHFGKTKICVFGSVRDRDNVDFITKWFERVVLLNETGNDDILKNLPKIIKAKGWARCCSDPFEETTYYKYRDTSRKHFMSLWENIKWFIRYHIIDTVAHPISYIRDFFDIKDFFEEMKDNHKMKKALKIAKKNNLIDFTHKIKQTQEKGSE